ncbi:MAG TPA: spermine/spermidine synthase [bacterium]|nr:spermine/spermidine synthase [bacterium]
MTEDWRRLDPGVPSGREVLARCLTATGDMQLQRRAGHYEIICNGVFLMASYNGQSERLLARETLAAVQGAELRVLVGGLGIGYTVQAVLEDRRVVGCDVVEIEPLIVDWHRRHFAPLCGRPLDDPRAQLIEGDLYDLPLPPATYDAILLDTDNGPDWLSRLENARLYRAESRARFLAALTMRGRLAVWTPEGTAEVSRRSGSWPGPAGTSARPGRARTAGGRRRLGRSP